VTLVAVLAGGRSRRMGAPKTLADLGGAPLIARPLAAAAAAGLEAVIVAKQDTALPALRDALAAGAPVRATLAALEPPATAVGAELVASVNTPDELAAAERAL
jgi:molybdopterin-guanine dinucleotide biosynthesis protein A